MSIDYVIAASARKHGVSDSDMCEACAHPIRTFDLEDHLVMVIGANRSGAVFEVGVVLAAERPVIVHAMPAREKFLR